MEGSEERKPAIKIDTDRLDAMIANMMTTEFHENIDEIRAAIGQNYPAVDGMINSLVIRSAELFYGQGLKDGIGLAINPDIL
jgi:hypothetical protein